MKILFVEANISLLSYVRRELANFLVFAMHSNLLQPHSLLHDFADFVLSPICRSDTFSCV